MKYKKCFKCNKEKNILDFYKHPQMPDGHVNKCKDCNKKDVKNNYYKNNDYYKKYDKKRQKYSIKRIFDQRYNGIVLRSSKKSKRKYKVTGKKVLNRDEYDKWCIENMDSFLDIYNNWVKSKFNRSLVPSIDRIDSNKSYTPENMQWLSFSDNVKKDPSNNWKNLKRDSSGKFVKNF